MLIARLLGDSICDRGAVVNTADHDGKPHGLGWRYSFACRTPSQGVLTMAHVEATTRYPVWVPLLRGHVP